MSNVLLEEGLHAPFGDGVTKDTRVVSDNFLDTVYLDFGPRNVKILPERGKFSNEVIAAPQTTCVDVVSYKDTRDNLRSHGHDPRVWLGHEVNEGTEGKELSLKVAKFMPSVVGGISVSYRDIR